MPDLDWRPQLTFFANEYPKNEIVWRLWVGLGTQLEKSERWNDALKWYLEGAKTQESINECLLCSVLYVRIGRIYQLRSEFRDLNEALRYYQRALAAQDPLETNESKQAQLYKGDIYLAQPDKYSFEETRTELEQALKLDPNSYWGLVDMGRLVMREIKDLDQAESYFQSAVNINPNHPYTYYLLGEVYRCVATWPRPRHLTARPWRSRRIIRRRLKA